MERPTLGDINPSIFKAYDIRGIYPGELDEKTALAVAFSFVRTTGSKKVVVGRDMRLSSPQLAKAVIRGVSAAGADVFDLGEVPTEFIYFAVNQYHYDAGIMITASHNPREYNGLKIVKGGESMEFVRGKDIMAMIDQKSVEETPKGKVQELDLWKDYIAHILSFVDVKNIKPFKVVVDAGNGMAGKVIPRLAPHLPIQIFPLNFELDGSFPAHPSNPLLEGVSRQASEAVKEHGADLGFIFDGDADRIFMLDEKGGFLPSSVTLLLLAKSLLEKYPSSGIAYNLICSKAVPQKIAEWGGKPIRTAVGFINVREAMMENNGVMGGEVAGHYCYKDYFYSDSGFISFLSLLHILSGESQKLSQISRELVPYSAEPEISFRMQDREKINSIIEAVKVRYRDGKQDVLDGLTVQYPNWWFNIRPSNTEPLLRLTIEADNQDIFEQKKEELSKTIREMM